MFDLTPPIEMEALPRLQTRAARLRDHVVFTRRLVSLLFLSAALHLSLVTATALALYYWSAGTSSPDDEPPQPLYVIRFQAIDAPPPRPDAREKTDPTKKSIPPEPLESRIRITPDRAEMANHTYTRIPASEVTKTIQRRSELPASSDQDFDVDRKTSAARHSAKRQHQINQLSVAKITIPRAGNHSRMKFVGRPPKYPAVALQRRWEGTVTLLLQIDQQGRVLKVTLHKSSGYPIFDAEAVGAARTWYAVPMDAGSTLVAKEVQQKIVFELERHR